MGLWKSSNIFESKYKNLCYLPARNHWITSQTSPVIHESELCWRYWTFASRDFSELFWLFWVFLISTCKLGKLFFRLFICYQTVHICIHDHFAQTMCKCHPSRFRHWDFRRWLSRCLMADTRLPVQLPPTSSPSQPPQTAPGQHRLGNNTNASGKCWKNKSHPPSKAGNTDVPSALWEILSVCTHRMA